MAIIPSGKMLLMKKNKETKYLYCNETIANYCLFKMPNVSIFSKICLKENNVGNISLFHNGFECASVLAYLTCHS